VLAKVAPRTLHAAFSLSTTLVGSLLGGWLSERMGVRSVLVIGGCVSLLAALTLAALTFEKVQRNCHLCRRLKVVFGVLKFQQRSELPSQHYLRTDEFRLWAIFQLVWCFSNGFTMADLFQDLVNLLGPNKRFWILLVDLDEFLDSFN
jgi:MFS family permease